MSNNQPPNGKKVFHTFAAGWLRKGRDGSEYISAVANGAKSKVKLTATLEDGTEVPVNSFAVFFADSKEKEESPDVRFVFTT